MVGWLETIGNLQFRREKGWGGWRPLEIFGLEGRGGGVAGDHVGNVRFVFWYFYILCFIHVHCTCSLLDITNLKKKLLERGNCWERVCNE